jgi:hypothetical protein
MFVNVTMYPQYNNNMIIKKELEYIEEDKSKNKNSNWETVAII